MDALRRRHEASIAICSDSQAALKSLQAAKVTSVLVAETMAALKELAIFNSVRLVWVPGHSGIPGNEEADRLAKLASLTLDQNRFLELALPQCEVHQDF